MSYSNFNSPQIVQPQPTKFIPPGKFMEIDDKFYNNKENIHPISNENFGRMGRPIQPFGTNVNYNASPFVVKAQGLTTENLNVNYLGYIYQQRTGYDANHKK